MELAYFVYEFPPYIVGGLGTYAEYMSRELIKIGHDVTVFSMPSDSSPTRDVYKGVEVHRPIRESRDLGLLLPLFTPQEIQTWSRDGQK